MHLNEHNKQEWNVKSLIKCISNRQVIHPNQNNSTNTTNLNI